MTKNDVRDNPAVSSDSGKVRSGDMSPPFPPARGKPASSSDNGKVRIGNFTPAFPPARKK